MKNKFKVGDRVHFTTAGEKVFKIVSIDSTQIPYELESIDNLDETFFTIESNIKLIPTMKNIKDLGEKVAIQCKTPEAFIEIKRQLNAINLEDNYWGDYKENTCIRVSDNTFSGLDFFIYEGYTIVQASDFMPLSPQDEIKELKERIATLEETLRPKKKIEFVAWVQTKSKKVEATVLTAKAFNNVTLLHKGINGELDLMKAWKDDETDAHIYLGHFNDGEK